MNKKNQPMKLIQHEKNLSEIVKLIETGHDIQVLEYSAARTEILTYEARTCWVSTLKSYVEANNAFFVEVVPEEEE